MSQHARLAPSGGSRWFLCPGSVRELGLLPAKPSSAAAIDGTHSHTLLEHCIKGDMADPRNMVGITLKDHEGEFTVDPERAERVYTAIKYIKERSEKLHPVSIRPEEKVDAGQLIGREDITGTADVQLVSDNVLEIMDYKDGMAIVDVVENIQMSIYAVGAVAPYWTDYGIPFDTVRLTIIQPKSALKGLDPIRTWEVSVFYLLEFVEKLRKAAEATDDPQAPLIPGEKQCYWCNAKGNCNEFAKWSAGKLGVKFGEMAQAAAQRNPNELSDEQIRELVEATPVIKHMLEAVQEESMRRFETGHRVKGLKVTRNPGRRKWGMSADEVADRLRRMGVPKASCYKTSVVSPAQVNKLSWVNKKGEKKSLSERQLKTLDSEYMIRSQGSLKVVPESEAGEAVIIDASEMFESVNNDVPDWLKEK